MATHKLVNLNAEANENLQSLISDLQSKYALYPPHPRQSELKKLCFGNNGFRAKAVLEVLLDNEPMQTPFKWVLVAGLCGWVIDPLDKVVARNMMFQEVELILEECSSYAFENKYLSHDITEIVGRYVLPGINFHQDIRFPIAGPNPQEILSSGVDLEIELESGLKGINSLNYCLLVLHWMSNRYNPKEHLAPSWNLVRKFAAEKRDTKAGIDSGVAFFPHYASTRLRDCWRRYMPSFSMIYAANYVNVTRGRTLLEMIISTQLNTRRLVEVLPEWLGKSTYYYANNLRPLDNTGGSVVGDWLIKNHNHQRFSPIKPSGTIDGDIGNFMKKKRKSTTKRRKLGS